MSADLQALLDSFDALSDAERHEATVELLRRAGPASEISEESLLAAADALFLELDACEEADARL